MPSRGVDRIFAIDIFESVRQGSELLQRGVEEADRAANRAALHVVIRRGELDQSLKKRLLVAGRLQPDLFPRFVRVPELVRVE